MNASLGMSRAQAKLERDLTGGTVDRQLHRRGDLVWQFGGLRAVANWAQRKAWVHEPGLQHWSSLWHSIDLSMSIDVLVKKLEFTLSTEAHWWLRHSW